ncbi:MAG: hypothetical protein NC920_04660 [Candidatus Omnitrophica bacterium]|nr:hypothetical protein [Candidatus Omnitrophota bacterium]
MSAIEIMALIVVLFSGIKIIVLLIKPELWINKMAKKLWAKTKFTIFISLMIAIISLVFLLKELSIVQIFAVILFLMALMVIGMAPYAQELINLISQTISKENILKKNWLAIIIWVVLMIWVLLTLF